MQAALLPRLWEVCGVRCASLTLWHSFILGEIGNPFACGGRPADRNAATELLLICSHDHAGAVRLFTDAPYRKRATRAVVRAIRRLSWTEIDAAVSDYMTACSRCPAHKVIESKGDGARPPRMTAAPVEWALVDAIGGGNPDALEAAWDTPYAVARCLFDARRDIRAEIDTLETRAEERRFDAAIAKAKTQ